MNNLRIMKKDNVVKDKSFDFAVRMLYRKRKKSLSLSFMMPMNCANYCSQSYKAQQHND